VDCWVYLVWAGCAFVNDGLVIVVAVGGVIVFSGGQVVALSYPMLLLLQHIQLL
jgi:hypothetical protein